MALYPTPEGMVLMTEAERTATELENRRCANLSLQEQQQLLGLLQAVYKP